MGSSPNSAPRPDKQDAPAAATESVAVLTVMDVARLLQVSRSKVYDLIASGRLAVHRLPAIRVAEVDVKEFLDGCRSQSWPSESRPHTIKLKHLR